MAEANDRKPRRLYVGVDVGGTKILAALARGSGKIVVRQRRPTPRGCPPAETVAAIAEAIDDVLAGTGPKRASAEAIGLAIPGVVDSEAGRIIVTPNMNLSGVAICGELSERFGVPVVLGNDVNLGTLAESWMGSASAAASAVGVFVGTGIGGGIVLAGRLVTGWRGAAAEIGHMQMAPDGPLCGCGGRGCLEALASRTAIERDIRQAVADGASTVLTELLDGDLSIIKSSMLRRALEREDELVTRTMARAAETLGRACLNIRHLLDPEVIVLGGGVVEACEFFLMPIVQRVVAADPLGGPAPGGRIAVASLGDDAVVLGAVAVARAAVRGPAPMGSRRAAWDYPVISAVRPGEAVVGEKVCRGDFFVRADGKVKSRRKVLAKLGPGSTGLIGPEELAKVCKGGAGRLIIGAGHQSQAQLTEEGERFLQGRGIDFEVLSTPAAVEAYNAAGGRKAALILVDR